MRMRSAPADDWATVLVDTARADALNDKTAEILGALCAGDLTPGRRFHLFRANQDLFLLTRATGIEGEAVLLHHAGTVGGSILDGYEHRVALVGESGTAHAVVLSDKLFAAQRVDVPGLEALLGAGAADGAAGRASPRGDPSAHVCSGGTEETESAVVPNSLLVPPWAARAVVGSDAATAAEMFLAVREEALRLDALVANERGDAEGGTEVRHGRLASRIKPLLQFLWAASQKGGRGALGMAPTRRPEVRAWANEMHRRFINPLGPSTSFDHRSLGTSRHSGDESEFSDSGSPNTTPEGALGEFAVTANMSRRSKAKETKAGTEGIIKTQEDRAVNEKASRDAQGDSAANIPLVQNFERRLEEFVSVLDMLQRSNAERATSDETVRRLEERLAFSEGALKYAHDELASVSTLVKRLEQRFGVCEETLNASVASEGVIKTLEKKLSSCEGRCTNFQDNLAAMNETLGRVCKDNDKWTASDETLKILEERLSASEAALKMIKDDPALATLEHSTEQRFRMCEDVLSMLSSDNVSHIISDQSIHKIEERLVASEKTLDKIRSVCLNPRNLALGKPTQQSSTDWGGIPSRAVDGNTDGHWCLDAVTHTREGINPWWEVDLMGDYRIVFVVLYNRMDLPERLSDVMVNLIDSEGNDGPQRTFGNTSGVQQISLDFSEAGHFDTRRVKVSLNGNKRILALAQVEVIGFSEM